MHFVQCSNRYYSSVSEEAMRLFRSLSLSLRRILSFCRDIHCYYIHTEGTITSPQEKALRPLFHSFSPSLAFFLSCWHPSILSAVLSLQFFVSVFYSFSFVFFFLSVIHLCPLPSPSRNIEKQVCENISSMPYSQ